MNQEYIFALAFTERAVSSVGSEHLVYTQGVGSSSLSPPTKGLRFGGPFYLRALKLSYEFCLHFVLQTTGPLLYWLLQYVS